MKKRCGEASGPPEALDVLQLSPSGVEVAPATTPNGEIKLRKNSPFPSPVLALQPSPSSTCVLQPRRYTALTKFSCRLDTSLFHMKQVLYVSPPPLAGSHPPPKTDYPTLLLLPSLPSPRTPLPRNTSPRHTKHSQMILNPFHVDKYI